MNRQAARELAATTLTGMGTFAVVRDGGVRSLDGVASAAVVLSKGTRMTQLTRDRTHDEAVHTLSIAVYVRCDVGSEASAEDTLDSLVETSAAALNSAGFLVGESDSAPEGAPLRIIDGVYYRQEIIPVVYEEWL